MNIMKDELYFYQVTPQVVLSGKETEISIRPLSPHKAFSESDYIVAVYPMTYDIYSQTKPEIFKTELKPQNGALCFSHAFKGEQEHQIRIYAKSQPDKVIAKLCVYSLAEDLYSRRPLMGDFHVHSCRSDGQESPGFVSAMYRQHGFDFAPITDHGMYYPSQEAIDAYKGVDIDFKIYHGEEIHTPGNHVHIINFASDYSVNELAKENTNELWSCNPRQEWLDEVNKLAESLPEPPEGVDKFVLASCLTVYKKVREGGGMCIFCHPHWIADVYHIADAVTKFFLENNFADAFELIGGQSNLENMMQIAMWQEVTSKGITVPVVGSSDSHGTVTRHLFQHMKTIVFAKSNTRDDIIEAVKGGYSAAVYDKGGDDVQMYSSYRMVSYGMFLFHNYFPLHDELCFEEGRLMREHIAGNSEAAAALSALKGRTEKLAKRFFGR